MSKVIAVYPGSFDPVTYGHIDLIERGLKIFDKLIVAVAENPRKAPLFSLGERVEMLRQVLEGVEGVEVDQFEGLLVKYAEKVGAKVVLRGVRAISDFEYEFQMALTNRKLSPSLETVFMMPNEKYSYLSSQLIKEIVAMGADVSDFVPPLVEVKLREKLLGHKR